MACWTDVAGGWPVRFAEVTAMGPKSRRRVRSASWFGMRTPMVPQAIGYFGTSVAAYLDGGPTRGTTASSIVDCAHGDPRVIRQGTISLADLSAVADMPIRETEGHHS